MSVLKRYATIYRTWQAIAARLRRPGAVIGLYVLLSIGIFDPLACIIHCSLLDVIADIRGVSNTHAHHHGAPLSASIDSPTALLASAYNAQRAAENRHPNMVGVDCSPAIAEPFHEMALLNVVVVLLVISASFYQHFSVGLPVYPNGPPPLRPPILYA